MRQDEGHQQNQEHEQYMAEYTAAYKKLHNKGDDMRTSNSGGDFKLAPSGMHVARCFKLIDCGTHENKKFGGMQHLGYIFWELPNKLIDEGEYKDQPFVVRKQYNLSHNEKATLRLDLENWYGKTFDTAALDGAGGFHLNKVMGRPAMLNIVHSDDGKYANIKNVNPLPDGIECPPPFNEQFTYELGDETIDQLSEKMREFIETAQEFEQESGPVSEDLSQDFDDDIPF